MNHRDTEGEGFRKGVNQMPSEKTNVWKESGYLKGVILTVFSVPPCLRGELLPEIEVDPVWCQGPKASASGRLGDCPN